MMHGWRGRHDGGLLEAWRGVVALTQGCCIWHDAWPNTARHRAEELTAPHALSARCHELAASRRGYCCVSAGSTHARSQKSTAARLCE